jgi:hypothetical protein
MGNLCVLTCTAGTSIGCPWLKTSVAHHTLEMLPVNFIGMIQPTAH